ncbi:DeoR/GlpR family DNA-binding transcription regulator [Lederbergia citrea]|uniref:DeoR/GlpR family DNA-binding transcription regulator n=1 Tax=Lederbergia citrea TaxID=2833581 RepID=UPI001BC90AEC|nr:DeoR/GlpR family DNA-binding transcription regulator [Lederbergia citrea]MBS4179549.1 DeoR/GlpR transcriptional regulator [Lederbergia citrea]
MSLLAEERKKIILEELDTQGKVQVLALAEQLQVSSETIRRDLDSLVKTEKIKRVYGGAVKISYDDGEPPYQERQIINRDAKMAIGKQASLLIEDGNTIFLDTGTTILEFARFIEGKRGLTIVTNSLPTASLLKESLSQGLFRGKLIILGGEISPDQQSVSGYLCEEMLKNFHVDKAFLSVGGVSIQTGISDYDLNESVISKIATTQSKEVIVLADHSKIGVQSFSHIADLDMIDVIISDKKLPASWSAKLEQNEVTWIAT